MALPDDKRGITAGGKPPLIPHTPDIQDIRLPGFHFLLQGQRKRVPLYHAVLNAYHIRLVIVFRQIEFLPRNGLEAVQVLGISDKDFRSRLRLSAYQSGWIPRTSAMTAKVSCQFVVAAPPLLRLIGCGRGCNGGDPAQHLITSPIAAKAGFAHHIDHLLAPEQGHRIVAVETHQFLVELVGKEQRPVFGSVIGHHEAGIRHHETMQRQGLTEAARAIGLETQRIFRQVDRLACPVVDFNGPLRHIVTQAAHIFGNHQIRGLHHRLWLPPDFFHPLRIVDKRIPVTLQAENGLVAGYLLLAYRVLFVPLQQKLDGPLPQAVIGAPVQDRRHPVGYQVFVTGHHIEISPGKVSFVLIRRLEYLVIITYRGTAPYLADSTFPNGFIDLPERHIAPHGVHMDVGRIQMEQIGVHRADIPAEPAFRETVFPVDAFAFGSRCRTPVPAGGSRGIHIPYPDPVRTGVDVFHLLPYLTVSQNRMEVYQFMQGCLEFKTAQTADIGIVILVTAAAFHLLQGRQGIHLACAPTSHTALIHILVFARRALQQVLQFVEIQILVFLQ